MSDVFAQVMARAFADELEKIAEYTVADKPRYLLTDDELQRKIEANRGDRGIATALGALLGGATGLSAGAPAGGKGALIGALVGAPIGAASIYGASALENYLNKRERARRRPKEKRAFVGALTGAATADNDKVWEGAGKGFVAGDIIGSGLGAVAGGLGGAALGGLAGATLGRKSIAKRILAAKDAARKNSSLMDVFTGKASARQRHLTRMGERMQRAAPGAAAATGAGLGLPLGALLGAAGGGYFAGQSTKKRD